MIFNYIDSWPVATGQEGMFRIPIFALLIDWFQLILTHYAYIEKLIDARVAIGTSISLSL